MLTSIMCVMELLERRLPEGDGSRKLVGSAMDVSRRAAKLTAQLLAFSRRQRLVAEAVDPVEALEDLRELLMQPLGEQVELRIDSGEGEPWLALADRNQLQSAVLNLVLNARAAIEGAGVVRIESRPVPWEAGGFGTDAGSGEAPLAARDYVAITVSDTGCGMSEEVRRRAFEPFFTTKAVGQGSGLGLSQAYGFAQQSGGTVRIESAPGRGTSVTMLLPRAVSDAAARARARLAPADRTVDDRAMGKRAMGETVLVAEDEDTLRGVVTAGLESQGFRVVAVRSGDEAAEIAARGLRFDVLFTDIVMPGGRTGVDLARELRSSRPDLPVIFTTGYSDRHVLEQWPGRAEVVGKPYSIESVARAISAARAIQAARAPAPA